MFPRYLYIMFATCVCTKKCLKWALVCVFQTSLSCKIKQDKNRVRWNTLPSLSLSWQTCTQLVSRVCKRIPSCKQSKCWLACSWSPNSTDLYFWYLFVVSRQIPKTKQSKCWLAWGEEWIQNTDESIFSELATLWCWEIPIEGAFVFHNSPL